MKTSAALFAALSLVSPPALDLSVAALPPVPAKVAPQPKLETRGYIIFVSWDKEGLGERVDLPKHTHTAMVLVRRESERATDREGKPARTDTLTSRVVSFLPENPAGMRMGAFLRRPVESSDGRTIRDLFPASSNRSELRVTISYPIEVPATELARLEARIDALHRQGGRYFVGSGPRLGRGIPVPADNCYTRVVRALGMDPSDPELAQGITRGHDATEKAARVYLRRLGAVPGRCGFGLAQDQWLNESVLGEAVKSLPASMRISFRHMRP